MDLRELSYFEQVARERSFTKAAQKLHLSQPALSKTIKQLEEEIGVLLFDRSEKILSLTDAGENLIAKAGKILEEVEMLPDSILDTVSLNAGHILVGIPPVIGTSYFPKIIADFRKTYPNIKFTMVEIGAQRVQEELDNGSIDIGIVISPVDTDIYEVFPVIQDKNVLLVHPNHPLASKKSVKVSDLREESFVILNEDYMLHYHIVDECHRAGFEPKIDILTSQWDFIVEMVSLNQGISILPRPIINRFKISNIKQIPIDNPHFIWDIIMITKKGRYKSFATKKFIRFVSNHFTLKGISENTYVDLRKKELKAL